MENKSKRAGVINSAIIVLHIIIYVIFLFISSFLISWEGAFFGKLNDPNNPIEVVELLHAPVFWVVSACNVLFFVLYTAIETKIFRNTNKLSKLIDEQTGRLITASANKIIDGDEFGADKTLEFAKKVAKMNISTP